MSLEYDTISRQPEDVDPEFCSVVPTNDELNDPDFVVARERMKAIIMEEIRFHTQ